MNFQKKYSEISNGATPNQGILRLMTRHPNKKRISQSPIYDNESIVSEMSEEVKRDSVGSSRTIKFGKKKSLRERLKNGF